MSNKVIQLILKILAAILAVLCSWFGVSAMSSCSVTRTSDIDGRAVIVTVDTTIIHHSGTVKFPRH